MIKIPIDQIKDNLEETFDERKVERLMADIIENGLKEPLKVLHEDGCEDFIILDGNHRIKALKRLGWKEVPCIVTFVQRQQHPYPRG